MSISISGTDSTQSQTQILMAQLQAQLSQQNSGSTSTVSSTPTPQDSAEFSPQAMQAYNNSKPNPLDALVSNGTITQSQETAIDNTLKTAMQSRFNSTSSTSSTNSTSTTDTANQNPLASLVSAGTITQAQSTAVQNALKSSHHGHHGHHGGSDSSQSSSDSTSSSQSSPLDNLVTAGTITQDQANAISSAFQSAFQSQSGSTSTNSTSTSTSTSNPFSNIMDSLVSNGTITQNQENTINSTFAAAMQAYGANQTS